jgi:hypothetical protein
MRLVQARLRGHLIACSGVLLCVNVVAAVLFSKGKTVVVCLDTQWSNAAHVMHTHASW